MKDEIKLSDHFNYGRLIRFTLPSISMMIFTSIYGVVDGLFVSNYVGETPFAALNLIIPYIMIFGAFGSMLGTGGSALVAVTLGMGDREKANRTFSLVIYTQIAVGLVFMAAGMILAEPAARLLGADENMLGYCVQYARISFISIVPFTLQYAFQTFFITAEKPKLGLYVTIAAGVTNMLLDGLLVGVLRLGLPGAAYATVASEMVGGLVPLFYFLRPNTSLLRLGRTRWDGRALFRTVTNGSSEFMSNVSMSLVSMLYNLQLMKYAGEDGVAAYGVIMYTNFIFIGLFFGYSMGAGPVVGFHYGAGDTDELKNVFSRSLKMIGTAAVIITGVSMLSARVMAMIFVSRNPELLEITTSAIRIYSVCYLFCGFNLFGSSFFTALNNGAVSALLSFMRALVFQVLFVFLLPPLFALNGIWFAIVTSEACALVLSVICLVRFRKRYQYA